MQLRRQLYVIVRRFPPEERFALASQLRRAAISVPSTIAEGHARLIRRDYRQYVSMARGTVAEIETQLLIAGEENYVDQTDLDVAMNLADEVSRMCTSLIRNLS